MSAIFRVGASDAWSASGTASGPLQQPPVAGQRRLHLQRCQHTIRARFHRTGGMSALVRLHPDDDHDVSAFHPAAREKPWTISRLPAQVVISPLLSQTTAAAPAGSTNPGRVSPKAAGESRARPASATTETLGQMAPRSSQVSYKSAVPCLLL